MDFKIRKGELKDKERINELATKLLRLHKKNLPNIFSKDKIEFSTEEFRQIVTDDNYYIVVAENENSEVIAFAYLEVEHQKEDAKLSNSKVACMSMIYIEEEYRRYGVGLELMKDVETVAKQKKNRGEVDRIELRIWGFNSTSEKFSHNRNLKTLYTVYEVL